MQFELLLVWDVKRSTSEVKTVSSQLEQDRDVKTDRCSETQCSQERLDDTTKTKQYISEIWDTLMMFTWTFSQSSSQFKWNVQWRRLCSHFVRSLFVSVVVQPRVWSEFNDPVLSLFKLLSVSGQRLSRKWAGGVCNHTLPPGCDYSVVDCNETRTWWSSSVCSVTRCWRSCWKKKPEDTHHVLSDNKCGF